MWILRTRLCAKCGCFWTPQIWKHIYYESYWFHIWSHTRTHTCRHTHTHTHTHTRIHTHTHTPIHTHTHTHTHTKPNDWLLVPSYSPTLWSKNLSKICISSEVHWSIWSVTQKGPYNIHTGLINPFMPRVTASALSTSATWRSPCYIPHELNPFMPCVTASMWSTSWTQKGLYHIPYMLN